MNEKKKGLDTSEGIDDILYNLKKGIREKGEGSGSREKDFVDLEERLMRFKSIVDIVLIVNKNLVQ